MDIGRFKRISNLVSKVVLPSILLGCFFVSSGCGKKSRTPQGLESTFLNFSERVEKGNLKEMKNFAEPAYVEKLVHWYEGAQQMSEQWPQNPTVVESSIDKGKATIEVEATDREGNLVSGTFHLVQDKDRWKLKDGFWESF